MITNAKIITSKNLVEILIKLHSIVGKEGILQPKLFESNPPSHLRYEQIIAIQSALGINETLSSLINGDFICKRGFGFYPDLKKELAIEKLIKRFGTEKLNCSPEKLLESAQFTYQKLMEYRLKLNETLELYTNSIVTNPLYLRPFELIDEINFKIKKEVNNIDEKLAYFIDPKRQSFTIAFLAEKFDYPNIDIQMVDLDNF